MLLAMFPATAFTDSAKDDSVKVENPFADVSNLSVVEYISDRIAVMYLGRILELAKTEHIFEHPMHPYTEALTWNAATLALVDGKIYGSATVTTDAATDEGGSKVVKTTLIVNSEAPETQGVAASKTFTEDGTYLVTVTATDNAGNVSEAITKTVQIDAAITTFIAAVGTVSGSSDIAQLLAVMAEYTALAPDTQTKGDGVPEALATLQGYFADKLGDLQAAIAGTKTDPTIAKIDALEAFYEGMGELVKDLTPAEQADYDKLLADRDAAEKTLEQLQKEDATYEDKQAAQNTYDSLTDDQKALVGKEDGMGDAMEGIKTDMAAVNAVIEKINAIQKPYKPEQKTAISEAKAAYDTLTADQKSLFPVPEKARLDALVAMAGKASAVEALAGALTEDSGKADVLAAQKAHDSLSADEKALVSAESKTALDAHYQAMLDKATADEKAAAAFTQQVTQTAAAPTVPGIEALKKAYDALSEGAKAALEQSTKDSYAALIASLTDAVRQLIKDLDAVDISKLTPESKDDIAGLKDAYDKLTSDEKKLVDTATDGDGSFGPNDPITREQLAAILYRYAQFKGMDTTAQGDLSKFTDRPSSWAAESVRWAVGAGLISGRGNSVLDPTGQATRAETAKILTNFATLSKD